MSPWPENVFSELVSDETGGNAKTLQSDYLSEGKYPIVDQGQALIGGYTNDASRVCKAELPVIVFGDHTKCFKYIDFPFCLGADGTKILKPKRPLDERYLFYALQRIHIPDAGYSRHFKYLKEGSIPIPPLEEQKRISAILDQADGLRLKRQEALDRLSQLGQAIFIEMFGEPVANPFGFPVRKLGELGDLDRGVSKHRPRNDPALLNGDHPLIQTGDVSNADGYIRHFSSTYSDLGLRQSRKWPVGTLCITIAANIGKTAILSIESCFPDSVVGFTPNDATNAEYVQHWMERIQKRLEEIAPQSAQKNINLAILRELPIPVPPIETQNTFFSRVKTIEAQKIKLKAAEVEFGRLFSSLQHRAFSGELTVSDMKEAVA